MKGVEASPSKLAVSATVPALTAILEEDEELTEQELIEQPLIVLPRLSFAS